MDILLTPFTYRGDLHIRGFTSCPPRVKFSRSATGLSETMKQHRQTNPDMEAASEERGDLFGDLQMTDPQRLTLEDACRRPTMGVGLKTVRTWHPAVSSCSDTALYKLTFTLCCVCKVIQLLNQVHMNPSQEKCECYFYRGLTVSFFNDLTVRKSHHSSVKLQQTHSPQRSSSLSLKSQDTFSFWRLNVILE